MSCFSNPRPPLTCMHMSASCCRAQTLLSAFLDLRLQCYLSQSEVNASKEIVGKGSLPDVTCRLVLSPYHMEG